MSLARSSSRPQPADAASGAGTALSSRFNTQPGGGLYYENNMYERASHPSLATCRVVGESGARQICRWLPSAMTAGLREAALGGLTAALSAGDYKHAVQVLWELHREDVFRYCRRMLGNEVEAADVTQRVFEHAIKGLSRLRSIDGSSRWLIGIARHRCLDHARSARRDPQLVDASTLCQIAGPSLTAEPANDERSTVKLLGECLERLDAGDRALIELRFYKGLPFKEIAEQLGRTPATLRVRLMRACLRLRGYLKSELAKGHASPPTAFS